jgi:hypothetical protein
MARFKGVRNPRYEKAASMDDIYLLDIVNRLTGWRGAAGGIWLIFTRPGKMIAGSGGNMLHHP